MQEPSADSCRRRLACDLGIAYSRMYSLYTRGSPCLHAALLREMQHLARQRRPGHDEGAPVAAPLSNRARATATESLTARLIRKARSKSKHCHGVTACGLMGRSFKPLDEAGAFYGKSLLERANRVASVAVEATKAAEAAEGSPSGRVRLSQSLLESSLAWHLYAPKGAVYADASAPLARRLLCGILSVLESSASLSLTLSLLGRLSLNSTAQCQLCGLRFSEFSEFSLSVPLLRSEMTH